VRESAVDRGAIVPGRPEASLLVQRITADDGQRMPPRKSKLHLSNEEIETLRRWIAEGAEYRPQWSILPLPETVPLPPVADAGWAQNPVDRFILARLDREGLSPSPPASREDWVRRVTFALTGLPPAPADVDAFLADKSPTAFARVVDRLLASPRFGERLAADWVDAARYADSFGYQADGDMHVWPWRDWVVDAFNANMPYDQFITRQLAGDLLENATRADRLATAFGRLNRMTNEGGSVPEEFRNEGVSDRVHTFGTVFLGLTLECARCHDHKYDPLAMKDYYALGAFFNSMDEWGTYDNSHFRPTPTLALPTPAQERELAGRAERVRRLEDRLTRLESEREPAFGRWLARNDLQPQIPGLAGHYPLDGTGETNALENRADPSHPGSTAPGNRFVPGKAGPALRFTGDDPVTFPHLLGDGERCQPYTVTFGLWTPAVMKEGVVFHRQSGTDTGFHGAELKFDEGRLAFALVRFWPGNAAAVRTRAALPAREWVQVAVSYDGSGKASGMQIYLNGAAAELEVVRDNLTKDLQTGSGHGGGGTGLTFGERFRSPGLKDCLLQEVRVYDRALAPIEIAHVFDGRALADALTRKDAESLRAYYTSAVDGEAASLRAELQKERRQLFAAQTEVFEIMTMAELPRHRPAFILARGDYDAPKDNPVARDTPSVLPPLAARGKEPDRLDLARWLTSPDHPLTARVAVNRSWQMFFGRGLVATAENFGQQGTLPTHPELLDWLARDFIASGWDVKALCRTVALSATFRQRSAAPAPLRQRDPDNALYARGPRQRLSAEMVRDAALAAGGLLVERLGGPPVKPYQPPGLWREQNAFLPDYVPDTGPGLHRRSLYTFWRRTSPPPNMLAFDAPGREVCVVRRQATTTPAQPLVLLNDPQFVGAAVALGERMVRRGGTVEERLAHGFRLAATRRPTAAEVRLLTELYEGQLARFRAEPDRAAQYVKAGGRSPPAELEPAELAASAVVAGAVLNLDAALMTR
jgi:hypothetical protein